MDLSATHIRIALTIIVFVTISFFKLLSNRFVDLHAKKHGYDLSTFTYVRKVISAFFLVLLASALVLIWDVSVKGLGIYLVSFFTLFGIAFFAQWSLLSSITASVILFFNSPLRVGNRVQIEADSIEGLVTDFTLFNIIIRMDDGSIVSYPNSLALQKPIKLVPRDIKSME